MKNILVTGGTGFIGSHTVVELVASGYNPVIVDNFSNSNPSVLDKLAQITGRDITYYETDFRDVKKLESIIDSEKIDGVIHFAAFKAVGESVKEPLKYYDNNVSGLIALLEVLERKSVSNLVFSSSCTVYGEPDALPITEAAPTKPATSPYGASKQMAETIIKDVATASSSLKALSLRYFNPIGAHKSSKIGELPIGVPANLIPFVTQAAAGLRDILVVHGNDYDTPDGSCIRDYIHVVDLAKAHVKALEHIDKKPSGYYDFCNIGTGQGTSVLEVIGTFEKVTGQKVPYAVGPRREGDIVKIYASVDYAQKLLGWKAEKTLAEALLDAWRWQKTLY